MDRNARRRLLFLLLLVALLLIGVGQAVRLGPFYGVALGCAPLFCYHFLLARSRPEELDASEVDSVYYFGFLLTIASLAVGVFFFQANGGQGAERDIRSLLRQFAVGVFATGYAVLARMHLQSRRVSDGPSDPTDLMSELVRRNQEVITHMLASADAASQLTRQLREARDHIPRQSAQALAAALTGMQREFTDGLSTSLSSLDAATQRLLNNLAQVAVVSSSGGLEERLTQLSASIGVLADRASSAADATLEAGTAASIAGRELTGLQRIVAASNAEISSFGSFGATIQALDAVVRQSANSLGHTVDEVTRVAEELQAVGDNVATAPRTMKRLADQTERTARGIEHLSAVAENLGLAAERLSRASEASDALALNLNRIGAAAPSFAESLGELHEQSVNSSEKLHLLATRVSEADRAFALATESAVTLGDARQSMISLDDGVRAFGASLTALGARLGAAERELLSASMTLGDTSRAAATALRQDLDAATRSAATVSDRLVQLVNTIITETNRRGAVGP